MKLVYCAFYYILDLYYIIYTELWGPPTVKPNNPWVSYCSLIAEHFYTQAIVFINLVQRECIPFPGPPEEKDDALPSKTLNIWNNSIY